jgi:hypothetical protein
VSTSTTHDIPTLVAAVRARAEQVGYEVAETPYGFRVERNLADVRYWALMQKVGVSTLTGHEVRVDPVKGTLDITDVHREIEWRAGNDGVSGLRPFWALDAEAKRGRIIAVGAKKTWGMREDGSLGTVEDYSFDTNEGRRTIRDAAAELGWRERMPLDQRIGLAVAVATVVGLIVCFGTWGLVALLG